MADAELNRRQMRKEEKYFLWLLSTIHLFLQFGFHYSPEKLSYKFARVILWMNLPCDKDEQLSWWGFKAQFTHFILFWDEIIF